MAYPTRDIFCIRTNNWLSIYEDLYTPWLYLPTNIFGTDVRRFVKNVAIEYDHSWSLDFPRSLYSLSEENSARGYLAKLPMDRASARNRDGPENIWLIDKGVLWMRNPQHYYWTSDAEQLQEVSGPKLDIATVYRDCDAEYVEVSWEHSAPRNADAIYPSSRAFITKLGMQFDSQLFEICWYITHPHGGDRDYYINIRAIHRRFAVEPSIRLLVPQDNEVKPRTKGCKTKCKDIGWCICDE